MAAKERESKTLDKFKQFFRVHKAAPINLKNKADFTITPELVKAIGPETPILQRIKCIRELSDTVLTTRLEDFGVERLWNQVKDLLTRETEREHRHVALNFITCLVQGQYEHLGLMRVAVFHLIKRHDIAEDFAHMFELLQELTHEGRDIHQIEDEFGGFLAGWIHAAGAAQKIAPFLELIVNFIKCNAAYVDDNDILCIVQSACFICCWSQDTVAVENSLKVLSTVVCYSELPDVALSDFVSALCRKVNSPEQTHTCWKVMRDLLGTHMGHSTLFTLCKFAEDSASHKDGVLLRGAVFFIHMGLWSDKKVQSLKCPPTSVLPSLLQALSCEHDLVIYEVILCAHRLVTAYGLDLSHQSWELIIDILTAVIKYVENTDHRMSENTNVDDSVYRISDKLHETITSIEQLVELGQFNGSVARVFQIIELSARYRTETSVLRLIAHQAQDIRSTRAEWITRLENMVERYYKLESRATIRIKVIEVTASILARYRFAYEEELLERVILSNWSNVELEQELCVRQAVAQLLITVCIESESKKCVDVFSILEKLLNRPFDPSSGEFNHEGEILDIKTVATGLIQIFRTKMHQAPAIYAVKALKMLIGHLELHYQHGHVLDFPHGVHFMIFEFFLKLRTNRLSQVGLMESSGVRYSPLLALDSASATQTAVLLGPAPVPFSMSAAFKVIVLALRREKDFQIINLLLQELPSVLQNKGLIADKTGADVSHLADALCSMVSDKSLNLPESLKNVPPKLSRTEFHSIVFPVIAAISAYHTYMEPGLQAKCIKCLECGLASRCAGQCVLAITTCTLEMRDAMYKLLPEVLLNLSKISATRLIAIPILEFLSTLTSLPKVFASFVGDQYMSVFAIALPYTNPFKYNHYTVSLAHHVIAVWFLKCRLPFRRDFVKFIINGLQNNALAPFEESQQVLKSELASLNEDSTSRKRSSSLTEQGSRRRERPLPNARLGMSSEKPALDETLWNFHAELKETCIDLMARYTFSSCEARPVRSPTVEALLHGGQSQTWLLGHKLITVTTSGCSQKPLKNNLCDRCLVSCALDGEPETPDIDKKPGERGDRVNDSSSSEPNPLEEMDRLISGEEDLRSPRDVCACWCQGWAEIHVRRPTGEMSWVMRLENGSPSHSLNDVALADMASLFLPPRRSNSSTANTTIESAEDINACESSGILTLNNYTEVSPVRLSLQSSLTHLMNSSDQIITNNMNSSIQNLTLSNQNHTLFSSSPQQVSLNNQHSAATSPALQSIQTSASSASPVHQSTPANANGGLMYNQGGTFVASPTHQSSPITLASNPVSIPGSPTSRQSSRESLPHEDDTDDGSEEGFSDTSGKSRNPVRRSNSSPEMSSNWKNPFLKDKGSIHEDSSKARVSCEAIPEEMTPPDVVPLVFSPLNDRSQLRLDVGLSVDVAVTNFSVRGPATTGEIETTVDEHTALPLATFTRDRSRTISVMSPIRKSRYELELSRSKPHSPRSKEAPRSGVSPSFVFLQLYHSDHFGPTEEKPILVSTNLVIKRAILALDLIPPFETHKVGVVYVGPGQAGNEQEILGNEFGSLRYAYFLQRLGTLITLKDADPKASFLGGLDKSGADGKFAYIWQDDVTQVTFHVATLMPNKESDPNRNAKKSHIGNDYVTIIYNESGEDLKFMKLGQFTSVNVVIAPMDLGSHTVTVRTTDELSDFGHRELKMVSDENLPILARQLALHANLASEVCRSLRTTDKDPYASNWLERLRKIKRLRKKVAELEESSDHQTHSRLAKGTDPIDDFTQYT